VIGADVHVVGAKVMDYALTEAGYEVVNLGIQVDQDDFINAAIETAADAILVSSIYGHGEIDCRGMRDRCVERGIGDVLLLVGGNLVIGRRDWRETESLFASYGFDGVYPPGTDPEIPIADLDRWLIERAAKTSNNTAET
jgi:methylaspartate mutase sigma subunit